VCPDRPADFVEPDEPTDTDRLVGELRALRQAVADACAAGDLRAAGTATVVGELGEQLAGGVQLTGIDGAHPLAVHDDDQRASVELDPSSRDALTAAVEDVGAVLHSDVWFVVGLLCALPFSYFLVRLVMPRA